MPAEDHAAHAMLMLRDEAAPAALNLATLLKAVRVQTVELRLADNQPPTEGDPQP